MAVDSAQAPHGEVLLIQFARAPREGHVKTRLVSHLGSAGACELHRELTLWTCRQLVASALGPVELWVAGDTGDPLFARCCAAGVVRIAAQRGNDLGQRMHDALRDGLSRFRSVILVGSDCPGIDKTYLHKAVTALCQAPVVVGPATDGGYVLIGARSISDVVFTGIPWGGDGVFAATLDALARAGLGWVALPALTDIDRPSDLPVWESLKRTLAPREGELPAQASTGPAAGSRASH